MNNILIMYQIQLKFKGQNKKINIPKSSLPTNELHKLIAQCFNIHDKIIGVTNKTGQFLELAEFNNQLANSTKNSFSLVTAKDVNQDNMSFGILLSIKHLNTIRGKVKNSFTNNRKLPTRSIYPIITAANVTE